MALEYMSEELKYLIIENQMEKLEKNAGAACSFAEEGLFDRLKDSLPVRLKEQWQLHKLPAIAHYDSLVYPGSIRKTLEDTLTLVTQLPGFRQLMGLPAEPEYPFLAALVGSGFFGQNPTIVCFSFAPQDPEHTTIYLSAAAKEGLIRQKSAENVVRNLTGLLKKTENK